MATENMIDAGDAQRGKFLTFCLGTEYFGIDIGNVTEITGLQPITPVPEVPSYVKGILNLRGKIIPVIDIRSKFGKESVPYTERTCIIVIDVGVAVGLIVDNVDEVLDISDENIVPPPESQTGFNNRYICGIATTEQQVILLLDCSKMIQEDL